MPRKVPSKEIIDLFNEAQQDLRDFRAKLDVIADKIMKENSALPYPYDIALTDCLQAKRFSYMLDPYLELALTVELAKARWEDLRDEA